MNETLGSVLQANNPAPLQDFFLSPNFIPMLVMGIMLLITIPFAIAGMNRVWNWYQVTFVKPKKGYIRVEQKLPNDQIRAFYVQPTGKFIRYMTYDKKDIQIPYRNEKGWIAFKGRMPTIQLDSNNKQIPYDSGIKTNSTLNQEDITLGYKASYETGKLMGSMNTGIDLKMLLIILLIVTVVMSIINIYMNSQTQDAIKNIKFPSPNEIAGAFLNVTSQQNPTTPVTTAPTKPATNLGIPFITG
jgi:hypothetical protein